MRHDCATEDRKLAIDRPCSACSEDPKMERHDHCPPFREPVASPQATRAACPSCGYTKEDADFHLDHHLCNLSGKAPWEDVAQPAAGTTPSSIEWSRNHLVHVQQFLIEMYQTMVDPVDEFHGNIAQLCELLLKRAREDREALNKATQSSEGTTPQAERPMTQAEYEVEYDELLVKYNEMLKSRAVAPVETPDTHLPCGHSKWDSRRDCIMCLQFAVDELNKRLAICEGGKS